MENFNLLKFKTKEINHKNEKEDFNGNYCK